MDCSLRCEVLAAASEIDHTFRRSHAIRFESSTISHSKNPANDRLSSLTRASAAALISGASRKDAGTFVLATESPYVAIDVNVWPPTSSPVSVAAMLGGGG
jgi:hypothetical protein